MDNTPNTFLGLIKDYKVEIPMIQRDYAQGRKSKKDLRKKFIVDIFEKLKNSKPCELDFIYGPIENNVFTPLDGQQRLTTLFLLHWYLAKQAGNLELIIGNLKKFTYKVRVSTQEFIDAMLNENKGGKLTLTDSPKIEIKDASWYYSIWDYDPSIDGMLNMLNTIHEKFKGEESLWKTLKENSFITFNLLIMNEYGLSDDLYMRMNARGLELTQFENVKAWLEGYCDEEIYNDKKECIKKKYCDNEYFNTSENEEDLPKQWTHRIDKDWTDLFWKLSESDSDTFDKIFMNFFNGMAQFAIADNAKQKDNNQVAITEDNKKEWIKNLSSKEEELLLGFYEKTGCFSKEILNDTFKILDFILDNTNDEIFKNFYFNQENLFEQFVTKQEYKDKVLFYAFMQYAIKHINDIKNDTSNFKHFKRLIRNLVENTPIDNDNFINAIASVNTLVEFKDNILEEIQKEEIPFFNKAQVNEEKLKASLICSVTGSINEKWESKIIEAENYAFFKGQIGFLLDDNGGKDIETFEQRLYMAKTIFHPDGTGLVEYLQEDSLFMRTMLSFIDDFDYISSAVCRENAENWRNILQKECFQRIFKKYFLLKDGDFSNEGKILTENLRNKCSGFDSTFTNSHKIIHENIVRSNNLLSENSNGSDNNVYWSWWRCYIRKGYNNDHWILIDNYRNEIICLLLKGDDLKFDKIPNVGNNFYKGRDIEIKNQNLSLYFDPSSVQLIIGDSKKTIEDINFEDVNIEKTVTQIKRFINNRIKESNK